MSFLPIVERELLVAARSGSTYRSRVIVAVVACLFGAALLLPNRARGGSGTFQVLTALAFLYCLAEGVRRAADCLSEEKREGTLGLLFLTDLRGYDVVLGKLASVGLRSFCGLIAFLPVLSIALLMGGITAGEFWRACLVLANTLFFSLAAGLFVSAVSWDGQRAMGGTVVFVAGFAAVPVMALAAPDMVIPEAISQMIALCSPVTAMVSVQESPYLASPGRFWGAVAAGHVLSWGLLAAASTAVRGSWQEKPAVRNVSRTEPAIAARVATQRRTGALDRNPVFWLATRRTWSARLLWALTILLGAPALMLRIFAVFQEGFGEPISMALLMALMLLIKVFAASQASYSLAEARKNETLELVLATPVTVQEVIRGQWQALFRLLLWPSALSVLLLLSSLGGVFAGGISEWPVMAGLVLFQVATFAFDLAAIGWVGMWMGLKERGPNRAFMRTVFLALVVPFLAFCVPNILVDLILIAWARPKVEREFRQWVETRWAGGELTGGLAVPPVLGRQGV